MNHNFNWHSFTISAVTAYLGLSAGCVEPNYRMDVRPTGQGGVEVYRIPKDDPAPVSVPPPQSQQAVDERIDELERQVRAQNAEILRLKMEKSTQPTTAP